MILIETTQLINIININTNYILCQDILWLIKEFIISEYAQKFLFLTDEYESFSIPFDIIDFNKMDISSWGLYDNLIPCVCHMPFPLDQTLVNDLNNNHLVINKSYIHIKCSRCPSRQEYCITSHIKYNGSINIRITIALYEFKLIIY